MLRVLVAHTSDSRGSIALIGVCLCVCLCVCLQHNSKMNDLKVFKVGVGNDHWISWEWYGFGVDVDRASSTALILLS